MARTKPPLVRPRTEGQANTSESQPNPKDTGQSPIDGGNRAPSPSGVLVFRSQLASAGVPAYVPSNLGPPANGAQPMGAVGNGYPGANGGPQYNSSVGLLAGTNGGANQIGQEAVGRFAWQVSDDEASSMGSETVSDSLDEEVLDDGEVLDDTDPAWGSRKRSRESRARRTGQPRSRNPSPQHIVALPGERRATRMWRQQLSDLLKAVLSNVKRKLGTSKYMPFQNQVDHEMVPDYSDWVDPSKEMWLQRIAQKIRMLEYSEMAQFKADIEAIRANCHSYNQPGNGRFGGPTLMLWADVLLAACLTELEANSAAITTAEAAIKDPECTPPAREVTERAATVRHVSNIPLPRGFKHTLRVTDSKPGGWVQYEAQCPVHGNLLKADRVAKLVDIFKAHAQCREEWNEFAMRPGEAFGLYNDRLREVFTFAKAVPPDTPSSRVVSTTPGGSAPAVARPVSAPLNPSWRPNPVLGNPAPGTIPCSLPKLDTDAAELPTRFSVRQQAADAHNPAQQPANGGAVQQPDMHKAEAEAHEPEAIDKALLAGAFKRIQDPLTPAFPPPSEPVSWPPRTNPPPTLVAPRSSSEEAEAAATSGNSGEGRGAQEPDDASDSGYSEKRRRLALPPPENRPAIVANGGAGRSLLPADVVSLARQRIQQEAQRYTEEQAGASLLRASSSGALRRPGGAGMADQSWGRGNSHEMDSDAGPSSMRTGSERRTNGRSQRTAPSAGGEPPLVLHFAPKVQPRQEPVEEPVQAWDGQGIFPRPRELSFLENRLNSRLSGSLLLLTGPSTSGKSTILHEVRQRRRSAAGGATDPFLVVDCSTAAMELSSDICAAIKAAFAEVVLGSEGLPAIPVPNSPEPVPAHKCFKDHHDLASLLGSLSAWLPLVTQQARPVLVLDAAHRLKEGISYTGQLLSFFERASHQGVHVVLATNDCLFRDWLAQRMPGFTVESMGDLTTGQARAFFAGLLQQVQAESGPAFQMERDWPAVRSVCGGNIGLLKRALEGLVSYGNLDAALKAIWGEAGRVVRQGLERVQRPPLGARSSAHTKDHYSAAVAAIMDSPYGAVPATDLEESLQPDGVEVLRSLVASGLVALREPSNLARDIPEAAYGPLQDRVVTLPSPAHGYFWGLISRESAHAYLAVTNGKSSYDIGA